MLVYCSNLCILVPNCMIISFMGEVNFLVIIGYGSSSSLLYVRNMSYPNLIFFFLVLHSTSIVLNEAALITGCIESFPNP